MGVINWGNYGEVGPNLEAQHYNRIGGILDAIMQRRQAKAQWEAEQAEKARQADLHAEVQREQMKLQRDAQAEAVAQRESAAAAQSQDRQFKLDEQRRAAWGKAVGDNAAYVGKKAGLSPDAKRAGLVAAGGTFFRAPADPAQLAEQPMAPEAPQQLANASAGYLGPLGDPMAAMLHRRQEQKRIADYQQSLPEMMTNPMGETSVYAPPPGPEQLAEEAGQKIRALWPNAPDDLVQQAMAAVASGLITPEKAYEHVFESTRKDNVALDRARIHPPRIDPASRPPTPQQNRTSAREDISGYLDKQGYKGDVTSVKLTANLQGIASEVAKGNWTLVGQLTGLWTKAAQGGTGVLTDRDIDTFWGKLGDVSERTMGGIEKWMSGGITPEKLRKLKDAIAFMHDAAKTRVSDMYGGAQELMKRYGDDGEAQLRAYFGRGFPKDDSGKAGGGKGLADSIADRILGGK